MKRLLILLTVILLVLPAAAAVQGQDDEWRVLRVQSLYQTALDLVGRPLFFAAPNGRQFAYGVRGQDDDPNDQVCTVGIALPIPVCVPIPREMAYSYSVEEFFPTMRWSPDSTRLAVVGEPYKFLKDSDLGLVDFGQMKFTNIADDQYLGGVMFDDQAPDEFIVDSQIAWSPDGTRIAMERTRVTKELGLSNTAIVIVDAATGEELQSVQHPLWGLENGPGAGTTVGMDWSPDGATLALSIRGVRGNEPQNGLWLLDVASGDLKQVYVQDPAVFALAPLRWSPDGQRLMVWVYDPRSSPPSRAVFWIDPATYVVTPLELASEPLGAAGVASVQPSAAAWSPDGSRLLVLAHHLKSPGPNDLLPLMDEDFGAGLMSLQLVNPATGEVTLLGHLPAVPAPAFIGEWGPDGGAILGAFQIELTRE